MALVVNTNVTSNIVQRNLSAANGSVNTSIERLSTGYKINRAADNAAGLPTATWSLKNFTVEQYNALFAQVKAGSISIDAATEGTINQAWFDAKGYSKVTVLYE